MKKLTSLVILLICAATVSAQLKQRIAVLPAVGDLEPKMLILLTDKVREIATQNLPIEDFNILKQDAIVKLIGEEELYRACKEGVCVGDLAKRTGANYGARCDIVKLDKTLVLKFEIYSVNEDAIFEMFTDYTVKDFYGMIKVLETRLPKTFQKLLTASKSGAANSALSQINLVAAPEQPQINLAPAPEPPQVDTPTTADNFQRLPEHKLEPPPAAYEPPIAATPTHPSEPPLAATPTQEPKLDYATEKWYVSGQDTGPRVLQKRISLEAGGIFSPYNYYNYNEEYWEEGSGSSLGGGGYLCLDAIYIEGVIDLNGSGAGQGIIGAFAKFPVVYKFVKVSPMLGTSLVGAGWTSAEGFTFGGRIEVGITETAYLRSEYLYCVQNDEDHNANVTSFKIGGGFDIGLGKIGYVRPELLYRFTGGRDYSGDDSAHSLEIRLGIGFGVTLDALKYY